MVLKRVASRFGRISTALNPKTGFRGVPQVQAKYTKVRVPGVLRKYAFGSQKYASGTRTPCTPCTLNDPP